MVLFKNKIVHRDLKPSNVLKKKYFYKLGDFGVSKIIKHTNEYINGFQGTIFYMSP